MMQKFLQFWVLVPWFLGITATSLIISVLLVASWFAKQPEKQEPTDDSLLLFVVIGPALAGTMASFILKLLFVQ